MIVVTSPSDGRILGVFVSMDVLFVILVLRGAVNVVVWLAVAVSP